MTKNHNKIKKKLLQEILKLQLPNKDKNVLK